MEINQFLRNNSDVKYKELMQQQIFTKYEIIGVRIPTIKAKAKEILKSEELNEYLKIKKFESFEEIQLFAYVVNELQDFKTCIKLVDFMLKKIDNWSNCDSIKPKIFTKNIDLLEIQINEWLESEYVYQVRFAIICLIRYFAGDDRYLLKIINLQTEKRYINMARAWFIAECLAVDFDKTMLFLKEYKLDKKTLTMTLEKSRFSEKLTPEQKVKIKELRLSDN